MPPAPPALHAGSLTLLPKETLKDYLCPKPGLNLLTCLQAFFNTVYHFKSFSYVHWCILWHKGLEVTTLVCMWGGTHAAYQKTPSSLLCWLHTSHPCQGHDTFLVDAMNFFFFFLTRESKCCSEGKASKQLTLNDILEQRSALPGGSGQSLEALSTAPTVITHTTRLELPTCASQDL